VIPVTHFKSNAADIIFSEVYETGRDRVVVDDNDKAICVLITPQKYVELMDLAEDWELLAIAEEREANDTGITYTQDEVFAHLGINEDDEDDDIVYGVDFE
jgi:hypothetical protein